MDTPSPSSLYAHCWWQREMVLWSHSPAGHSTERWEKTEQRQIEQQRQKASKKLTMGRLDSPGSLDVSLFSWKVNIFLLATAPLFQVSEPKAKVTQ